jgi:glutamine amidotransferase
MGFNLVKFQDNKYKDLDGYYYFIHSFKLDKINDKKTIVGRTRYSDTFISFFQKNNIVGAQFHPEKSGQKGLSFIKRFVDA